MTIRTGMASQIGFKTEAVYGTAIAVDRFYPLVSESLEAKPDQVESDGIIAGRMVLTSEQWEVGNIDVGGDVGLELYRHQTGLLWSHILGSTAVSGSNPYTHTATLGDLDGKSFTVQKGVPGLGGTVHPITYAGCKVASWELAVAQGETAKLGLTVLAQSEDDTTSGAKALQAASYTAGQARPFLFKQAGLNIGGSAYKFRQCTVSGDNHLAVRRNAGSQLIEEPHREDLVEITVAVESELVDLTQYNRVVAGTEGALVLTFTDGTYSFTFTINARFDGETPKVDGKGVMTQNLAAKLIANGSDAAAVTAVTINQNAAA